MERTLLKSEKAYRRLEMVAMALTFDSPNNARYEVEDCYLDFGQNWMWTTIVRHGYKECQVLSPKEWDDIMLASSSEELAKIVKEIENGKYFGDR